MPAHQADASASHDRFIIGRYGTEEQLPDLLGSRMVDVGMTFRVGYFHYEFRGERSLRFSQAGARIFLESNGGPPTLIGVALGAPDAAAALDQVLSERPQHLVVMMDKPWPPTLRAELSEIPSLTLGVCGAWFDDTALKTTVELLPNMHCLTILDSPIADLTPLQSLTQLRFLHLWNCRNACNLSPLDQVASLEGLHLEGCAGAHSDSLQNLKRLRWLSLIDCGMAFGRGGTFLKEVVSPSLRLLHLQGRLDSIDLVTGLKGLETLSVHDCSPLPSIGPVGSLGDLRRLELVDCHWVEDLHPLLGARSLKELTIRRCEAISNWGPLEELKGLSTLSISECGQLKPQDAASIRAALPDCSCTIEYGKSRSRRARMSKDSDRVKTRLAMLGAGFFLVVVGWAAGIPLLIFDYGWVRTLPGGLQALIWVPSMLVVLLALGIAAKQKWSIIVARGLTYVMWALVLMDFGWGLTTYIAPKMIGGKTGAVLSFVFSPGESLLVLLVIEGVILGLLWLVRTALAGLQDEVC